MNKTGSQREDLAWVERLNLSFIVYFHNEVKRNFQNEIARMNQKLEDDDSLSGQEKTELEARKRIYLDTFEPYLRINTFLMMVSHFEEWLFCLWKHCAPEIELFETKGSIGRFKPVLQAIGVDLSRSKPWIFLKGCQDVRSCLLHANGRFGLNRKSEKLQNFIAQHSKIIAIESDRLVLKSAFLKCFQHAIEELLESARLCQSMG